MDGRYYIGTCTFSRIPSQTTKELIKAKETLSNNHSFFSDTVVVLGPRVFRKERPGFQYFNVEPQNILFVHGVRKKDEH